MFGGDHHPPKFERARVERNGFGANCFISGTAAIRGEISVGGLDAAIQTRQTIENINYLISEENLNQYRHDRLLSLKMVGLRVYIKKKNFLHAVKSEIDKVWPDLPVIYLLADICREELLVEIEGTALEELIVYEQK